MKIVIHRNPLLFPPSPCSSVGCAPSERQINNHSSVTDQVIACEHQPGTNLTIKRRIEQLYLPRPAMPLSSLGSKDEEERCENTELKSEAVWTGVVVVVVVAAGVGGCGLRSPVRLSKGTGVIDAVVTSLVLTWGFTWFLLQRGKGEDDQDQFENTLKTYW